MRNFKPEAPELTAVAAGGITRGAFIARSALTAGAAYGGSAAGPLVKRAFAQDAPASDLSILNFALTLEILEAAFYEQALDQVGLSGDLRSLTEEIRVNEDEHVDALTTMISDLGGEPVDDVSLDFGDAFASEQSYLALAQTLEDTGVSAYNGAAPLIQDTAILSAAGTIVQIEGRHAALIRLRRGEAVAPRAFDQALDMPAVMERVAPFIRS